MPALVMHGEDDQIVPLRDSAKKSTRLTKGAKDMYYPGASCGLTATHHDQVNRGLLAFIKGRTGSPRVSGPASGIFGQYLLLRGLAFVRSL